MELHAFSALVSSEARARRFFVTLCRENGGIACPRCLRTKPYRLGDARLRCRGCAYTFHEFTGRFLKGCAFDCRQWLWFLKLFALGMAPKAIAGQMGIGYDLALRAQDAVRRAIVAESLDANTLYRMGVHPGAGMGRRGPAPEESPVFGVIAIKGEIFCDVVAAYDAATILHYKSNFHLQTGSVGGVVYTAPIRKYRSLVGCGPAFWPTRLVRHDASRLAVDSLPFWTYAKDLFAKQRGVTAEAFPLILKDAEFRYNHRNQDLLDILAPLTCRRIPRPASPSPDADACSERRPPSQPRQDL